MIKNKTLEFKGNAEVKLKLRFRPTHIGDEPMEYYNIDVIIDSTAVEGGSVKEQFTLSLVPKHEVIDAITNFLER